MSIKLIENGTLIDGTGRDPIEGASVLIDGRRINAAGKLTESQLAVAEGPQQIERINAKGGYILPGMIDTHVHLVIKAFNVQKFMGDPFSLKFYEAVNNMQATLDAGVTAVRDAGGADAGLKAAVEQGVVPGPRMQISIVPLTITGGHGDGWMLSNNAMHLFIPHPGMPDGQVDGVPAVRQRVREVLRAGADWIKVHATGGVLSPTDHPQFSQFSPEELRVMVEEGQRRRGVKVMAHAQGAEGIKNAVRAGVASIEHGIYLDDEAIDLMLEHGTYLVPTLLALVGGLEIAEEQGTIPEYGVRKAREALEYHMDSIARAYEAGVKIAMGTDCAVTPHGTNLRELGLMCQIGMSPMEAIVATTKTAAECMGWGEQVGTVEAGKLADVIVSEKNPLADVTVLEDADNITLVMKDGEIVKDVRGETQP